MKTHNRYSPELREWVIRMVFDHGCEYDAVVGDRVDLVEDWLPYGDASPMASPDGDRHRRGSDKRGLVVDHGVGA